MQFDRQINRLLCQFDPNLIIEFWSIFMQCFTIKLVIAPLNKVKKPVSYNWCRRDINDVYGNINVLVPNEIKIMLGVSCIFSGVREKTYFCRQAPWHQSWNWDKGFSGGQYCILKLFISRNANTHKIEDPRCARFLKTNYWLKFTMHTLS